MPFSLVTVPCKQSAAIISFSSRPVVLFTRLTGIIHKSTLPHPHVDSLNKISVVARNLRRLRLGRLLFGVEKSSKENEESRWYHLIVEVPGKTYTHVHSDAVLGQTIHLARK